jgi:uncharacterized protein (DUF1501 family)
MNRRQWLANAAALAAVDTIPGFWWRAALAAEAGPDAPTLVVVELNGGNDGLNTVIPYRDDAYHRARPTLRIAPDKVLKLDDALGLHPSMTGLHKLWEQGKLRVAMNVGYPKPSRSHSRALEIWQAGEPGDTPTTGWLGRVADQAPGQMPPCFIGPDATPLAVRGRSVAPFALGSIADMQLHPGARFAMDSAPPPGPADRVARAMATAAAIDRKVKVIHAVPSSVADEDEALGDRLATVLSLIKADFGSRIYYTSLGGFDTHAAQEYPHQSRLRQLSRGLARFQAELAADRLDERVVVLVFSEFGRRVQENGSKGTDHGAAAPVLLLGSPVSGGVLGIPPDLADLDDGDLRFRLDFRQLYASILADWLRVDPTAVVGPAAGGRVELFRS